MKINSKNKKLALVCVLFAIFIVLLLVICSFNTSYAGDFDRYKDLPAAQVGYDNLLEKYANAAGGTSGGIAGMLFKYIQFKAVILGDVHARAGGFAEWVFEQVVIGKGAHPLYSPFVVATFIFKFASFNTIDAVSLLSGDTVTDVFFGADSLKIADIGVAGYNVFKIAGLSLILLYFIMELLDLSQADQLTVESFLKRFVVLAIAIIFMLLGSNVFYLLMNLGDSAVDAVFTANSTMGLALCKSEYAELVTAGGGFLSTILVFFTAFGVMMKNVIPSLLYTVATMVAFFKAFGRYIEVIIRFMFAPIGCAPLAMGSMRNHGIRYIKKFAAVCLEGAVCIGVLAASQILNNLASGTSVMGAASVITSFIIPLTCIGVMSRAGRISEEIVGV